MLANSLELAAAYLVFGFIVSSLARGGWAEDWDESLLASILGPPLFTLITAAVLARFVWTRLPIQVGGPNSTAC
jgi:hypothetical protein